MTRPSIQGEDTGFPPIGGDETMGLVEIETTERVHGQFERALLYSSEFVKMSQVRGEKNTVSEELKASIERTGLINSIDVAHLDEATLIEYINFVNEVWGSTTSIDDFVDKRRPDGTYYLVIAGHSRHQAITELEDEGRIAPYRIEAKVHQVTTPEQIIQIQLDENIHSQPPRERRAVAIVETYEWGVRMGKWKTQKEFLEYNGNVGKSVLSEALAFSNVPPHIRNFVFKGRAAYDTGIELGKAAVDIKEHILFRMGKTESRLGKLQKAKLATVIERRLTIEMDRILNDRLNTSAAKKKIHAMRAQLRREINEGTDKNEGTDQVALFELGLKDPEEILNEELAKYNKQLRDFLIEYSSKPSEAAREFIELHGNGVVDGKLYSEVVDNFQAHAKKAGQIVGATAMTALDITF